MKKIAIAILVAATTLCIGGHTYASTMMTPAVLKPPKKYAGAVKRPFIIYVADPNRFCRQGGLTSRPGWTIYACSGRVNWSGQCAIVLPAKASPGFRASLLRHELAHCKGWKHK